MHCADLGVSFQTHTSIYLQNLASILPRTNPLKFARSSGAAERLPRRIILVRHGESAGNADKSLLRTVADNLIELTDEGVKQASLLEQLAKFTR